jgi:hypothetical protein
MSEFGPFSDFIEATDVRSVSDERTFYGAMCRNLASSCAIRELKIGREDVCDRS